MAGGRYAQALLAAMEQTREVERAANEQADLARRLGDTEREVRFVRAQSAYEGMVKVKERLAP